MRRERSRFATRCDKRGQGKDNDDAVEGDSVPSIGNCRQSENNSLQSALSNFNRFGPC